MQKSVLGIHLSTPLLLGSLVALGLSAAACGSSTDAPTGGTGDSGSGGGSNATGGAKNSGGSKSSGGTVGSGGAKASGGSSGSGGSKATGGSSGSGGTATGGGGGDGGPDGCADPETLTVPANVPTIIQTPAGVTLVHHFHATGTQNYKCTGTPVVGDAGMTTYAWPFVGPEADLSDNCAKVVGTHFAGPLGPTGPQWKFTLDESLVQGAKDQASPVTGSIPELLLHATDHGGTGEFSDVTFIQRLATTGGVAPDAATCSATNLDEVKKVPYTADYYFYTGPVDAGP